MNKVEAPPARRRPRRGLGGEGLFFAQREKIRRVHRLVLMGDAEMDVAAQRGLHQSAVAHVADDLPGAYRVPGLHRDVLAQAGVPGEVAAVVADDHGVAHGAVLVDGVDLAVRGGADLSPRVRGDVHAVVDAPVPGGLIVAQRFHGVGGDLLAGNRRRGLERLLRGGSGGGTLRRGGRGLSLGLGSQRRDVLGFHGSYEDVFPHGFLNGDFLHAVGVSIVYIAGDPDGGCAQDQGYVVALSAAAGMFVVAHLLSTSEADYCRDFRRLNIMGEIFR